MRYLVLFQGTCLYFQPEIMCCHLILTDNNAYIVNSLVPCWLARLAARLDMKEQVPLQQNTVNNQQNNKINVQQTATTTTKQQQSINNNYKESNKNSRQTLAAVVDVAVAVAVAAQRTQQVVKGGERVVADNVCGYTCTTYSCHIVGQKKKKLSRGPKMQRQRRQLRRQQRRNDTATATQRCHLLEKIFSSKRKKSKKKAFHSEKILSVSFRFRFRFLLQLRENRRLVNVAPQNKQNSRSNPKIDQKVCTTQYIIYTYICNR